MTTSSALRSLTVLCSRHITANEALLMQRLGTLRRHPWLIAFFITVTRLGDGVLWWGSGLAFLALGSSTSRWAVAAAGVAVTLCVALFMTVKDLIGRPRPFAAWTDLSCLLVPPDKFSFPSGHTMTAFAVYAVYSPLIPRSALFFLPLAILIGISRVVLGCHYPTDVLVGALLGTAIGWGVAEAAQRLLSL